MKVYYSFIFLFTYFSTVYSQISITDFGAIPDGKTLNTQAIQTAIDRLHTQGGGTLTIPKGVFLTGSLVLKSNIKLKITEGGCLTWQ